MSSPLVEIQDLTKTYGEFVAVGHLTLAVQPGEILALLGPNGAGKTTTIRMLMGILSPTSGTATIAGHDCFAGRAQVMAQVGYLPDEPIFYDHLTGGEIVRFCGEMRGMRRDHTVARGRELAERLEIEDALDDYAINYSMGMRKKLALLCAMLHRPAVLILDEPTNGLDPFATRSLLELIRATAAEGAAVFYSTHLLPQAEKLATRIGILHRGRVVALGTLDELRGQLAPGASLEDVFFQLAPQGPDARRAAPTATGEADAPA